MTFHLTCVSVAANPERRVNLPVAGKMHWYEAPAAGVVSSQAAPTLQEATAAFTFYSTVDAFIAVGGAPNASTGPRMFVPANTPMDLLVEPGDRFAWTAAA